MSRKKHQALVKGLSALFETPNDRAAQVDGDESRRTLPIHFLQKGKYH